ncbi:hypothetical protein OIU79_005088 [Salix purpurea]|uniref:Uncharacterized protein n=1 Tax=Salix purpurea TaxID=77065 RepID=A0A9Q0UBN0_SALPP|nr:hypothetical protein OIU79_005088 [Salix purpurea]
MERLKVNNNNQTIHYPKKFFFIPLFCELNAGIFLKCLLFFSLLEKR